VRINIQRMCVRVLGCFLVLLITTCSCEGLKVPTRPVLRSNIPRIETNNLQQKLVLVSTSLITSILPTPCFAADNSGSQTAVFIPILISFLTIGPFLYYQQALKPKERTVKQIELDRNLRVKDKSVNMGGAKEARAEKKK